MRRIIRRVLTLRKSMLVQMALLTSLFFGWGLYTFVVRPLLDLLPVEQLAPLDATGNDLRDAFHDYMRDVADRPDRAVPLAERPIVRAVTARNPAFRYYVRVGGHVTATMPPLAYRRLGLDRLERVRRGLRGSNVCSQMAGPIGESAQGGYADLYMCDEVTYFEYRGLTHATGEASPDLSNLYDRLVWPVSSNFLITAGGMFLIVALTLMAHMIALRRVARLAGSFDPQHLDRKLPETGVASEIVPLVRAVNHMIAQVGDYQRRNAFFLSAAAHEMRTPLTVLRTRLEMLDEGSVKDKLVGDVRRLVDLVNQLLALMTIGNRRDVAGFADVVDCCTEAIAEVAVIAAPRGVTIMFATDVPAYEIAGDAALVRSAIANIVRNAVSFSPEGAAVDVRLAADGRLTVRDAGPGIAQADPAGLFEPFVRFPPGRRGHGLGLAIVKSVATLHGATVEAANAAGGGAVFTIAFPGQG